MLIRRLEPGDTETCAAIVLSLPDYFTDDVPGKVRSTAAEHGGWVITEDPGPVVGFAIVERRSAAVAEILWAAVVPERRGLGSGTRLVEHVLRALAADGVHLVEVKTLDGSAGYAPYEATRAFWEGRGFLQIDAIDPYADWDPGSPAAICVAALAPTAKSGEAFS